MIGAPIAARLPALTEVQLALAFVQVALALIQVALALVQVALAPIQVALAVVRAAFAAVRAALGAHLVPGRRAVICGGVGFPSSFYPDAITVAAIPSTGTPAIPFAN